LNISLLDFALEGSFDVDGFLTNELGLGVKGILYGRG
jgi:hypothetical protein